MVRPAALHRPAEAVQKGQPLEFFAIFIRISLQVGCSNIEFSRPRLPFYTAHTSYIRPIIFVDRSDLHSPFQFQIL